MGGAFREPGSCCCLTGRRTLVWEPVKTVGLNHSSRARQTAGRASARYWLFFRKKEPVLTVASWLAHTWRIVR